MQIRKLYYTGNSVMVSIPRAIILRWERDHVRHVIVHDKGTHITITPMKLEDLMRHPATEEEGLRGDAVPDPNA